MFDPSTTDLIRRTPPLEGLDRDGLPDWLSDSYARIVAARLRLRAGEIVDDEELAALVSHARRLAFTNEALVSVSPNREDRAAAAFVAATAHQLVFNAERIREPEAPPSFLDTRSVSPDIAAMLLFLVAEASADALEMARRVRSATDNRVEGALIAALRALAQGRLNAITETALPARGAVRRPGMADTAASALYRTILKGVRTLAGRLLAAGDPPAGGDPLEIFRSVKSLCADSGDFDARGMEAGPVSVFSGPSHLASILIAVAGDIAGGAVVAIPPPGGIDPARWRAGVKRVAKDRPFLWRNHRKAISDGYLEPGVSAVVGFPTGAGKSALAELKIRTALLTDKGVVFLAPTHALVDQTRNMLARAFPGARVQHERLDEFGLLTGEGLLPEILVATPEACLAQMSFDASVFEEAGLLVFDECHLLHPYEGASDRRALDAMLCVLNFVRLAPDADLLLLSAMMRNTEEIAEWLEYLTGRRCLALSLPWKPTRQLRGSVVYQDRDISELRAVLHRERQVSRIKGIPTSARQAVPARPFGLFSLKQTWATIARDDYALLPILEEKPLLGINASWRLTPNSGEVSSAIAAAAARSGIKTLIFFQTIRNAVSASRKVSARLGAVDIRLSEEERALRDTAARELGGGAHLYLDANKRLIEAPTAVHHGLLLPEERRLVEALYKREDGLSVLTATSTIAQGMNLPSELVIIAEDSRFDQESNRLEILEAQELLNAAGRAGRAGYNANGIVLVVPGKVVGIDYDDATIGPHWAALREIFGQSDQCLDIDDPLTAVLDRVHANVDDAGALERYCIAKLAGGGTGEESGELLSRAIRRSLGGFRARRQEKENWLLSRTEAASQLLAREETLSGDEMNLRGIAATVGFSVDVVVSLAEHLADAAPAADASVTEWRRWFFGWLSKNPKLLEQVFRPENLENLFGSSFKSIEDLEKRAGHALPYLRKLTRLWMKGRPLRDLEIALGIKLEQLKACDGARKFMIRIVPELAYAISVPALLAQHAASANEGKAASVPSALAQLGYCVRHGFDAHEKAALHHHLRNERLSRRMLHDRFKAIRPYLNSAPPEETWEGTLVRVRTAMDAA